MNLVVVIEVFDRLVIGPPVSSNLHLLAWWLTFLLGVLVGRRSCVVLLVMV